MSTMKLKNQNNLATRYYKSRLCVFLMSLVQMVLFFGLVNLLQAAVPPKHFGVNEGIGVLLIYIIFGVLSIINSEITIRTQSRWIPYATAAIFIIVLIIEGGMLAFYPHRTLLIMIIALASFAIPFEIERRINNNKNQ